MKTCTKCKVEKELSEFHKRGMNKSGVAYQSWCKKCISEKRKRPKKLYVIPKSKVCSDCKIDKPMENFHKCSSRKDGRQHRCKDCNIERSKRDYRKNSRKGIFGQRAKNRRMELRDFCDSFKSKGCTYCNEKELCCLEFHHFNPKEKKYEISILYENKSLKRLLTELPKCIVVCCNCHKKIHNNIITPKEEDKIIVMGPPRIERGTKN